MYPRKLRGAGKTHLYCVQKIITNPRLLRDLLDREIAALDCLVERAMKKRPESVRRQESEKTLAASV
jgi:hypothetical protein